jgi:hypothetical protein
MVRHGRPEEAQSRQAAAASVKRGGTALGIAVAVALGLLVLALAWALAGRRWRADAGEPLIPAGRASAAAEREPGLDAPARGREASGPNAAPAAADPARFRGRGRIRGELLAEGVELPRRWTLVLEPHPWLVGGERAASRRVALPDGARTFDVSDLPLGGYRVRAEAEGLNSSEEAALLVRGSADVFVSLVLRPAGLIDGFVLDSGGMPAQGLEVVLEHLATRARRAETVDGAGQYVFRDVVDGEYRLLFGATERPFEQSGDIRFRAPTLRWREVRLPPTGALRLTVRDERGTLIPDAAVSGFGTPQGVARGTTGPDGVAEIRWLWPARYHLGVQAPDGRSGQAQVVVQPDAPGEGEAIVR